MWVGVLRYVLLIVHTVVSVVTGFRRIGRISTHRIHSSRVDE